jgi:hypothetical protein
VILGGIGADLRQAVDAKNRPRRRVRVYTLGRFSGVHHPPFHGPSTVGSNGKKATMGRERPCNYVARALNQR